MPTNLDAVEMETPCVISGFNSHNWGNDPEAVSIAMRLMEMGVADGVRVVKKYAAPVSQDPIAIEVGGQLVALRRKEAAAVLVKRVVNQNEK